MVACFLYTKFYFVCNRLCKKIDYLLREVRQRTQRALSDPQPTLWSASGWVQGETVHCAKKVLTVAEVPMSSRNGG
jgi:hypothetical protein